MDNMRMNDMKMMSNQLDHNYRVLQEVKAACASLQQINLVGKVSGVDGDAVTMTLKTVRQLQETIEKLTHTLAQSKVDGAQ